MNFGAAQLLFALLRQALFGVSLTENERALFPQVDMKRFLEVAKKHDVIHLIGKGLVDSGLVTKESPYFTFCQKAQVMAVLRYEQLEFELHRVAEALERAKIPFLPLKGSVLRAYYPEPWMRTSCDIDVLVHNDDLNRAIEIFQNELGYKEAGRTRCDIAFATEGGLHIELHFDLIFETHANGAHKILEHVWDYATAKENYEYWHVLSDDMFYYYHIAHMAKHFENGGCGIRPFIDVLILNKLPFAKQDKREELLKKGNLLQFAVASENLSLVWFQGQEHNVLTSQMESFLIFGGAFGNMKNHLTVWQQKKGGKRGYFWSRIFPDRQFMGYNFHYVKKNPWLMPVAYVHRAFVILFRGNAINSVRELKANNEVDDDNSAVIKQMLDGLGLL